MPGLLDYLPYLTNPIGNLGAGAIGGLMDFYKNQMPSPDAGGPQVDQMGNATGINTTPAPPPNPFTAGAAPVPFQPQTPAPVKPTAPPALENPIAVGNYQMPRIGNADQFIPQQAMTPPTATPTQGQRQPQEDAQFTLPQSQGGLSGFGRGFAANLQGGPLGALVGGIAGAAGMGQGDSRQRMGVALFHALKDKMDPQQALAVAQAAMSDPKLAEVLLPQALGLKPPSTMEGVLAERAYNGKGGTADAMKDFLKLKQGVAQAEKSGQTVGEQQATAQLNLPSAVAQSKEAMSIADRLLTHKGREGSPFFHSKAASYLGDALIPGNTEAYDANSLLSQLKGGAFLNAYATLRGGGQISNNEGAKAEQAILRANRAQSKDEFDQAIRDFKSSLQLAIDNANYRAGETPPYGFQGSQMGVGQSKTVNGVTIRRVN